MITLTDFLRVMLDIFIALIPLVIIFFLFQLISLKMSRKIILDILRGFVITFVGLVFFIYGLNISFINNGEVIGEALGNQNNKWIVVFVGFLLGFVVTLAEPAIKILNTEIEKVTSGYINNKIVLIFISIGVSFSVALSLTRIMMGWPLWYFLLPLYILAFLIARYAPPTFVGIAFDSGGVVTGPVIATFLLSLTLGISTNIEGSVLLIDSFGMISMVAVVPIITVLILGILYDRASKKGG